MADTLRKVGERLDLSACSAAKQQSLGEIMYATISLVRTASCAQLAHLCGTPTYSTYLASGCCEVWRFR